MENKDLKSGVTLVELMIAMVLALVLSTAVFFTYNSHSRTSAGQQEVSSIQGDLSAIMDMIEKDVRNAGCNPNKGTLKNAFEYMPYSTATTLGINADLYTEGSCYNTSDGKWSCPNEQVRYSRNTSNQLVRRANSDATNFSTPQVLANNVTVFTMNCTTGTLGTPNFNQVKQVTINLTLQGTKKDPDTGQFITRSLSRMVVVRNYGLN